MSQFDRAYQQTWQEVRVTFIHDHEDETTWEGDEEFPVMMFWKDDTFYAEVADSGDSWLVHILDQETHLEWYAVPKAKVEIRPVRYYNADVTFRKAWRVRLPNDEDLILQAGEQVEAGVVDDGTGVVDLLLNALIRPVNQIKQVPLSILGIENERQR